MSKIGFTITGGDYRYKYLYDLLIKDGYNVKAYDNQFIVECCDNINIALDNSDIVIAPIPFTKDNKNVFLNNINISIDDFILYINRAGIKTVICGVVSDDLYKKFMSKGINIYDFFKYEEVAIKNAIPTAEGAIMTAIEKSDKTLFGSKALVIGYGRCGKILSRTLSSIGADVSVTYRKQLDRAYIDAFGMKSIHIDELLAYASCFDFIFNTAPAPVIDREILKRISKDTIIIDLAQAPGGVDFSYAKKLNVKALYCPGIPGRTAPCTAAEILKDIVISIAIEG